MSTPFETMTPQDFEQEFRLAYEEYNDTHFLGHFWQCDEKKRDQLLYILCSVMDGTATFDIFANRLTMCSQEELDKLHMMLAAE